MFAAGDLVGVFVDFAVDETNADEAVTAFVRGDAGVAVEIPVTLHRDTSWRYWQASQYSGFSSEQNTAAAASAWLGTADTVVLAIFVAGL